MKKIKAFTLIELLVVIAIIALLLAVLLPSLAKVKGLAKMVVCMTNHKNLTLAWRTYSGDNSGKIVNGHTERGSDFELDPGESHDFESWVEPPCTGVRGNSEYTGGDRNTPTKLEDELNGIRNGMLYKYLNDDDVYRCPSDNRKKLAVQGFAQPSSFRSYSITGPLNGENRNNEYDDIYVTKESQIRIPSNKFVFMDDFDNRSWNMGGWMFDHVNGVFEDPIAVWHFKKCNFSYADGHVSARRWVDQKTIDFAKYFIGESDLDDRGEASANNDDVLFLAEGFKPR